MFCVRGLTWDVCSALCALCRLVDGWKLTQECCASLTTTASGSLDLEIVSKVLRNLWDLDGIECSCVRGEWWSRRGNWSCVQMNEFGQRPTEELLARSTCAHDASLIVSRALAVGERELHNVCIVLAPLRVPNMSNALHSVALQNQQRETQSVRRGSAGHSLCGQLEIKADIVLASCGWAKRRGSWCCCGCW